MAASVLQKITTRAKQIRKKQPGKKWTACIKQAAREIKAGKKVGATLLIEKGESRRTKPKKVIQVARTKKGIFKKGSRIIAGMGSMPKYEDPIAAREIELFYGDDSKTYFQARAGITRLLVKRWKAGKYEPQKAALLIRRGIETAMRNYNQEHGSRGDKWSELLSVNDRKLLALQLANDLDRDMKHNPKQYDNL